MRRHRGHRWPFLKVGHGKSGFCAHVVMGEVGHACCEQRGIIRRVLYAALSNVAGRMRTGGSSILCTYTWRWYALVGPCAQAAAGVCDDAQSGHLAEGGTALQLEGPFLSSVSVATSHAALMQSLTATWAVQVWRVAKGTADQLSAARLLVVEISLVRCGYSSHCKPFRFWSRLAAEHTLLN